MSASVAATGLHKAHNLCLAYMYACEPMKYDTPYKQTPRLVGSIKPQHWEMHSLLSRSMLESLILKHTSGDYTQDTGYTTVGCAIQPPPPPKAPKPKEGLGNRLRCLHTSHSDWGIFCKRLEEFLISMIRWITRTCGERMSDMIWSNRNQASIQQYYIVRMKCILVVIFNAGLWATLYML